MTTEVEVNMRIPTVTVRSQNEPDKRIDNSSVRFTRRIEVPAIPKPGDSLQLTTGGGEVVFDCMVTRAEWHEEKALFIVSCNYSKRSISVDMYSALVNDNAWTMKQLL